MSLGPGQCVGTSPKKCLPQPASEPAPKATRQQGPEATSTRRVTRASARGRQPRGASHALLTICAIGTPHVGIARSHPMVDPRGPGAFFVVLEHSNILRWRWRVRGKGGWGAVTRGGPAVGAHGDFFCESKPQAKVACGCDLWGRAFRFVITATTQARLWLRFAEQVPTPAPPMRFANQNSKTSPCVFGFESQSRGLVRS